MHIKQNIKGSFSHLFPHKMHSLFFPRVLCLVFRLVVNLDFSSSIAPSPSTLLVQNVPQGIINRGTHWSDSSI